ncbi:MAG: hypothetical protein CVV41_02775 [Candidatus Riflebacteria bacterium HGW-Riflebacteria-1]|jgi:class 3 adenylate cyclase|nr:MAG: hypothetical protein CVV41_02775 [Candidatus Riflebacteria bacterium HGW-Riflebacteria-1]
MKVFKARQKAGFWVLLLAWLLIVVAPAVVFRRAFSMFLETRLYQSLQRVQPQLYTELQYFVHDLDETSWLEKRLKDFDQQQQFLTHDRKTPANLPLSAASLEAKDIHRKLEKHLGFQVLSVFCHGIDTSAVDAYVKKIPACELRAPSATMLRRFFAVNNNQTACEPLLPSSYIAAFPEHMLANAVKNQRIYGENFIQNYFGTIVPGRVVPGEILRTIASKAGKTGQIFLYYGLARQLEGKTTGNLGGYFVAIRLQDIPESAITRAAISRPFYPAFVRKTGYLQQPLPFPENYADMNLSAFVMEKERYSLRTVAPQRQISRIAQQGTIFPGRLDLFSRQTPCIEVSCPLSDLEHPLTRSRVWVELIISIMALTGSMIFFRLYLYGFDLRLTIAFKIVAAVVFACMLPVLSLILSTIAYDDYDANADKEKILRQLKMRNSLMQTLLNSKTSRYEQNTRDLATDLYALQGKSDGDYRQFLAEWCQRQPVAGVIYKKLNDSLIEFWADDFVQRYDFKARRDSKWVMLNSVEEMALASPLISDNPESVSALLANTTRNQEMSQFLLNNRGHLVSIPRVSRDTRVSFMLVTGARSDKVRPVGFVIVDYDVYLIIQNLTREIKNQVALHDVDGSLQIDIALGQIKDGRIELIDELTSASINRNHAVRQMESCYKLKKEIQWSDRTSQTEVFSLAYFDQNLPLVVVTQISRPISSNAVNFWWLPALYALLVIALVILITRAIFIAPAQQLINGLEEIASGNLEHQLVLETGDEFESIGNECNSMTESLIEKARLEQYVSAEVLEEIRRTTEVELQPGGERIAATVLFASLHIHDPFGTQHSTAKLELLNLFLGISDAICTQNAGRLDKIIGHTIMMVFRSSISDAHHQEMACNAALQIKSALESSGMDKKFVFSAGLSAGTMISGKIGSRNGKLDYTVIGDAVNTAARLKAHAATFPQSTIICSESMAALQSELFTLVPGAEIRLKGKSELCRIYQLTAATFGS